ncbi:FxsA family protein [Phosphitispora sp. TUW77]|uniref:FxsA family protein n=1 Tax=Phosphitispora sp. TUW77 TaxID=3152361 RepID=UPI003AB8C088
MLKWIFLFMLVPAAEIFIYIQLGKYAGLPVVVLLILGTGAAGVILTKQQGFYILTRVRENLQSGIVPGNQLLDGLIVLVGAIMLLSPGLLTDLAGFSFLIPFTRFYVREIIKKRLRKRINEGKIIF